jgi:hypothetical protein
MPVPDRNRQDVDRLSAVEAIRRNVAPRLDFE